MICLHKILPLLFSPLFLIISLIILGLILNSKKISLTGIAILIIFSLPIVSNKLLAQLESDYESRLLNPYIAAERGSVDLVIHPEKTRIEISAALDFLITKREKLQKRLHSNTPL